MINICTVFFLFNVNIRKHPWSNMYEIPVVRNEEKACHPGREWSQTEKTGQIHLHEVVWS